MFRTVPPKHVEFYSKEISASSWFYYKNLLKYNVLQGDRGGTVVKVLCYKSDHRWFDSRWCHWNFSLT